MFLSIFVFFWDVFVHYEQIWAECGLPLVLATESKALDKKLGIGCGHRYGMCSGMHCIDRATQSLAVCAQERIALTDIYGWVTRM